jgi:hypothetical protein
MFTNINICLLNLIELKFSAHNSSQQSNVTIDAVLIIVFLKTSWGKSEHVKTVESCFNEPLHSHCQWNKIVWHQKLDYIGIPNVLEIHWPDVKTATLYLIFPIFLISLHIEEEGNRKKLQLKQR